MLVFNWVQINIIYKTMEISQKGIDLIKEFEGCLLTAYKYVAWK